MKNKAFETSKVDEFFLSLDRLEVTIHMSFDVNDIVIEKVTFVKNFIPCPPKTDKNFWDNADKYEFSEDKTMYKFSEGWRFIDED